jgi:hypothetical protein
MCAEFLPGNAAAFSYDELKSVEGARKLKEKLQSWRRQHLLCGYSLLYIKSSHPWMRTCVHRIDCQRVIA